MRRILAALVLAIGMVCPSLPAQAANNGPCPTGTLPFQTSHPINSAGLLCDSTGSGLTSTGGVVLNQLNSSSATACTNLVVGPVRLEEVWEAISTESVTLTLYNEGASPTCAAADAVATLANLTGVSPTSQPIKFAALHPAGLSYKLSGTLTGGIDFTRF